MVWEDVEVVKDGAGRGGRKFQNSYSIAEEEAVEEEGQEEEDLEEEEEDCNSLSISRRRRHGKTRCRKGGMMTQKLTNSYMVGREEDGGE